ncbi:MAG: hypothetical protein AMJ75_07660 [Phycisphaerae bacterium SM1_79]|nr:MAG: hypothetical protein AMJ75_07660 [Phycisphaerae bacterium SM1_79]
MSEFPFQLLIKHTSSANEEEALWCTALLRVIPGRRQVYDALWNNRSVIVKVFSHKTNARHHLKREWQGLNELQSRGLSAPEPLFYGRTEDGRWTAVLEKIVDSSTVLDALNETTPKRQKRNVLMRVCKELAKQHSKGVLQRDLHLGNYLLRGDKIYVLDPSQMQFFSGQIPRKKSISQLALLASCLPAGDMESAKAIWSNYFKARGWHFGTSDELLLQSQLIVQTKRGIKRGLKKCLRTSKRQVQIKAGRYAAVFDRDFSRGAEPLDLIEQIDALMDKGQILKNGNTCYVSRLKWNDKDVVVKRYNHKGWIHSLRHTIKSSRARRAWLHAHRLAMLQIPTPKPLAYIEQRKGPLLWKCYLVTEHVQGQKLYYFLRDRRVTEAERSAATRQVVEMLENIGKYKISHGDLKHSNILITDHGPTITDLDGMKVHRWSWAYKARRTKDIARLTRGASGQYAGLDRSEAP